MRAITIRQPWAWAVATGAKDIENRSRSLGEYRGLVAIHAGQAWSHAGFIDDRVQKLARQMRGFDGDAHRLVSGQEATLPAGVIIAVGRLAAVHRPPAVPFAPGCDCSPWADMAYDGEPIGAHLRIRNVVRFTEPVPAKGRLGLWTLPEDVEAAVLAELARSTAEMAVAR